MIFNFFKTSKICLNSNKTNFALKVKISIMNEEEVNGEEGEQENGEE